MLGCRTFVPQNVFQFEQHIAHLNIYQFANNKHSLHKNIKQDEILLVLVQC